MKDPLVTVFIPTCNRSALLKRAINSVLEQTYTNIEIIVSDDCSDDDTKNVMDYYVKNYSNIRYSRNSIRLGACKTRNKAINISKGYFITGLDDDDAFEKNRIKVLVDTYREDFSFVCSNISVVDKLKTYSLYKLRAARYLNLDNLLWFNEVGNQVLTTRQKLLAVDGFNEELSSAQDYDLWIRLIATFGQAYQVKDNSYIHYKDHDEPRITTSNRKLNGMQKFIDIHCEKMNSGQIYFHRFRIAKWKRDYFQMVKNFFLSPPKTKMLIIKKVLVNR